MLVRIVTGPGQRSTVDTIREVRPLGAKERVGRVFHYAGSKSVLMTLWAVAEDSSVKLTESFVQHRKTGKSKLESLKLARDEIRKEGFEHPFFWSAFNACGGSEFVGSH